MGLLDTIRSILGLDSAGDGSDRGRPAEQRSTDVRVEHDPDEADAIDTESEAAVKGTDDSPEHAGEALAAGTDAAASTDSLTEEPDTAEEAAEPGEATGVTEHAGTEKEAAEPAEAAGPTPDEPDVVAAGDESEEPAESEAEGSADAGEESVEVISGIGQAYGKRLSDAGVETVADLAAADAADLADTSGISEKRIAGWKESAEERLE